VAKIDSNLEKVYRPESALRRPHLLFAEMWNDLLDGRGLAWRLAARDISAQYRQTALGFLWLFILPLFNTLAWIFLQSSGVVSVADTDLPYPVYVFVGTMVWAIFTEAFTMPLQVVTAAKPMLAKINFPREALLLSGIIQVFFNSGIKVVITIAALLFFGSFVGWHTLLIPLAILALIIAGTALGTLFTPLGLLYTDVTKALPIAMQFLMYLTPVVFPIPQQQGLARTIFTNNPLTPLIMTARDWMTGQSAIWAPETGWITLAMAVLLIFVWTVFKLALPILIERMNA
jgi:lipopolysaccharide transport system permease protein